MTCWTLAGGVAVWTVGGFAVWLVARDVLRGLHRD